MYCGQPQMINYASPEGDRLPFFPKVTGGVYKTGRRSGSPDRAQVVYLRLLKGKHAQL